MSRIWGGKQEMKKNAAKETKAKAENAEPSKRKLISVILGFILVLFSGTFGYLYSEGYLEGLFPNEEEKPAFSLFKQDENGFYYYQTDYEPGDYYFSAKNLSGDALREELQKIIRTGFNPRSYEEAKHILAYCDRDPLKNNESVRGICDSAEIATYWIGTGSGAWQREHVWPNSKLGVARVGASQRNQASDIHNLRAITGINQTRSNRYFADGSGEAKTVGTEGFYPGDEHKGDVARILFYMPYVDLFIPNETEFMVFTGDDDLENSGKKIFSLGAKELVVTLGSKGYCHLYREGIEYGSCPKVEAVDTTAAGDTFCGALAAELSIGSALKDALRFATKAASIAVTAKGAQSSIPDRKKVESFKF